MKGGGIYLVTGKPGHGKSYYAVLQILWSLARGLHVATNIQLTEGWAERMARHNPLRALSRRAVKRCADDYRARLYVVRDIVELTQLRLPACGSCRGCRKRGSCRKEGRGVAVLDEAHTWLDPRTWNVDETGAGGRQASAILARKRLTEWFSQHRHRGWRVFLVTQDPSMIDPKVRALHEQHIRVKNVRRLTAWWNPFRFFPVPIIVAIHCWGGDRTQQRIKTETMILNRRLAELYDTMARPTSELDNDAGAIYLGQPRAAGEPAGSGEAAPPADAAAAADQGEHGDPDGVGEQLDLNEFDDEIETEEVPT